MTERKVKALFLVASLLTAAIPTFFLADFVRAALYELAYGLYSIDLNEVAAHQMALIILWLAIAYIFSHLLNSITNDTAT